jgi:hypothetical protein
VCASEIWFSLPLSSQTVPMPFEGSIPLPFIFIFTELSVTPRLLVFVAYRWTWKGNESFHRTTASRINSHTSQPLTATGAVNTYTLQLSTKKFVTVLWEQRCTYICASLVWSWSLPGQTIVILEMKWNEMKWKVSVNSIFWQMLVGKRQTLTPVQIPCTEVSRLM